MNSKDILQSDLLDIVFDKRNKAYGAYELRKHYRRRLFKSLAIAFVIAGGIGSVVLFVKKDIASKGGLIDDTYIVKLFEEPKKIEEKPVQPKKQEAPKAAPATLKKVAQQQWTRPEITDDPTKATKLTNDLDNLAISNVTKPGQPYTGEVFVPEPIKINEGGEVVPVTTDVNTPRHTADVMPSFPGGMNALKKFMEKNLRSFDDIEEGKAISVKITFVVGFDGKLKSFQILEDGGDIYSREVIRVLKKMPEWIPGKANGENVSVYYTIPVKFMAPQ
jgi:periplasmic protein TonB